MTPPNVEDALLAVPGTSARPPAAPLEAAAPLKAAAPIEAATPVAEAAKKQEILLARARALARPPVAEQSGEFLEVTVFPLAGERYALETALVREAYPLRDITTLPCTPPHVHGIISVRGQIVAVLDLERIFGLPSPGVQSGSRVIVLGHTEAEIGVLVETVTEVSRVLVDSIHPAPPTIPAARARYLHGVTADHLVVINAEALLTDTNLVVNETVGG